MTKLAPANGYGDLIEPATLKIERLLPGPIERIWAYLTESELRRQWLASGDMEGKVGAAFEFDPPRKLAITWGSTGGVSFELAAQGEAVLLTVIHRRVLDRATLLNVSAGWHAHLNVLAARAAGKEPAPFWDGFTRLKSEYETRLPA